MASTIKRVVRDRLVNDSSIRGFLNCTTTGSCPVSPVFMERSGVYPQIIFSEILGNTDPGMSAANGVITFDIEVQSTGGLNPHTVSENILERIDQLFDDQPVTGLGISGTSVYTFIMLREGGPEITYNPERKIYQRFCSYSYKVIKY